MFPQIVFKLPLSLFRCKSGQNEPALVLFAPWGSNQVIDWFLWLSAVQRKHLCCSFKQSPVTFLGNIQGPFHGMHHYPPAVFLF